MEEILMSDLDQLVTNLENTFKHEKGKFQVSDENPNCFYLTDVKIDYPIEKFLIDFEQISDVNWATVRYLKQRGYKVYAGEKDGFGWLTGCIEPDHITREVLDIPENQKYVIVYG